jgi:hypothetical protein
MKKLIYILNNPYITNNRMGNKQIKGIYALDTEPLVKPKPKVAFTQEEKEKLDNVLQDIQDVKKSLEKLKSVYKD